MNTSEHIRSLARDGMHVADIARHLGIRYQHAYKVLKAIDLLPPSRRVRSATTNARSSPVVAPKPPLPVEILIRGGFELSARWILSDTGDLMIDRPLPKESGVYAFASEGIVLYVGVTSKGLATRLAHYSKPGPSQITNRRLNALIKHELHALPSLDIYTAIPPDLEWNGLPVHGSAGLELGLIKKFSLPWNKQSTG